MKGTRANATNLAKYEQLLNALNTPLPRMNLAMRSFQVGQVKNHKDMLCQQKQLDIQME